jgi:hypothetical protein
MTTKDDDIKEREDLESLNESLTPRLIEALDACVDRGMQLPFIVCVASPNGSVLCMRFNDGAEPDKLAEHYEPEGFSMPISLMVIDQTSKAVRIVIEEERLAFH